jgi:hypothetical protein
VPKSVGVERMAPSAGVEPTNPTFVASGPYPRARRVLVAQCGLEPQSGAYEAPAFTHVLQRRKNGYQSSMDLASLNGIVGSEIGSCTQITGL